MMANHHCFTVSDTLGLDAIAPRPGSQLHAAQTEEQLPMAPSKWDLTIFLVPYGVPPWGGSAQRLVPRSKD